MKVKLVCPQCSYGFEAEESPRYRCPIPECGHEWHSLTATMVTAFTAEGRHARPELVIRSGERTGLVYAIDKPRVIIGRADDCDITFSNLGISRHHAEIQNIDGQPIIIDMESRLGTYVNGLRVKRAALKMGDQILLSGILIEYRVRYEANAAGAMSQEPEGADASAGMSPCIRFHHKEVSRVPLGGERVTLGRHPDRDVYIEHPLVSRRHAALVREEKGWSVIDTKSRNGTFVNGRAVIRQRLARGDRLQMGPIRFIYDGENLVHESSHQQMSLACHALTVRLGSGETILQDVDLSIAPSELVGIIGPSGSGKTTLLNALSGYRRATSGQVALNERDLYAEYSSFRANMGYVPQDDIIHTELTATQALRYAARLRLPRDTSPEELDRVVSDTLETLGLEERRDLRVARLSGGQRKRVSLGVELLTRANLVFMDEPTSGLDPGTEARLMHLFRRLADQGRTIVLTTHVMENVDVLDKVGVLYAGRLVFFGRPSDMRSYFGIARTTDLYAKLENREPEEWAELYARSRERARYLSEDRPYKLIPANPTSAPPRQRAVDAMTQVRVLTERYTRILAGDRRNVALMAIQPLIIFPAICGVFQHAGTILFLTALAMVWLGITNAAREIVKERPIYLREQMVGVTPTPYVLSKIIVLLFVSVMQTLFAVLVVHGIEGVPGDPLTYGLDYLTATVAGLTLGLLISSIASTSEQATAVLPMVLIPQIVFGGFILDVERMNTVSQWASGFISTRWTYEALKFTFQERFSEIVHRDLLIVTGFALLFALLAAVWLRWRDRKGLQF